jgi:CubicO group peptidase (beta-lactamase class C family)
MRMQFRADQGKGPGTPAHSVHVVEVVTIFAFWLAFVSVCPSWADSGTSHPTDPQAELAYHLQHFGDAFGYARHVVHRGDSVSELPRAERPLNVHYRWSVWKGDQTLDDFLARTGTTGFLVLKDGKIVSERYFMGANEKSLFMSESVAKSFTSTLVGLALADGKIQSVDRPVTDYVPELKDSGFEGVSIEDLLEMSSGINFTEEYTNPSSSVNVLWHNTIEGNSKANDFAKSLESAQPPGRVFVYQSINTQVLGWLVRRVTGESLADYLSQKIWQPLGMERDATWVTDRGPDAMEAAYCCLNVTLRDFARFGLLFMNKGKWNGRQVVPEQWVVQATTPHGRQVQPGNLLSGFPLGYGYQWWTSPGNDHAFSAIGLYQQFIYVSPADGVVIVKTSAPVADYTKPNFASSTSETFAVFEAICQALRGP